MARKGRKIYTKERKKTRATCRVPRVACNRPLPLLAAGAHGGNSRRRHRCSGKITTIDSGFEDARCCSASGLGFVSAMLRAAQAIRGFRGLGSGFESEINLFLAVIWYCVLFWKWFRLVESVIASY